MAACPKASVILYESVCPHSHHRITRPGRISDNLRALPGECRSTDGLVVITGRAHSSEVTAGALGPAFVIGVVASVAGGVRTIPR